MRSAHHVQRECRSGWLLARACGLTEELRTWCRAESQRDKDIVVGEVGLDLIAGQKRLVVQSLFDLLSDREL